MACRDVLSKTGTAHADATGTTKQMATAEINKHEFVIEEPTTRKTQNRRLIPLRPEEA
jgi:hypothetical protein